MADFSFLPARWGPPLRSVLRVVAAFLYMLHGTQKLFGFPAEGPSQTVPLLSQMGLAGVLETFGGLLILLGLFTRPVAFVLAGEMAVAYFQAHAPQGFFPILNRGELPVLFHLMDVSRPRARKAALPGAAGWLRDRSGSWTPALILVAALATVQAAAAVVTVARRD